jgi:hypothetical protein
MHVDAQAAERRPEHFGGDTLADAGSGLPGGARRHDLQLAHQPAERRVHRERGNLLLRQACLPVQGIAVERVFRPMPWDFARLFVRPVQIVWAWTEVLDFRIRSAARSTAAVFTMTET